MKNERKSIENRKVNWNITCPEPFDFANGDLGELPGILFRAVCLSRSLNCLACQSKSEQKYEVELCTYCIQICLHVDTRSSMTAIVSVEEIDFGGEKDLDFLGADCKAKAISTMRRIA